MRLNLKFFKNKKVWQVWTIKKEGKVTGFFGVVK